MSRASLSRVKRRVEDWKMKLIDLSRRNRLIYFTPTKRSNIFIERPRMATVFNRLVVRGRSWEIWQPPHSEEAWSESRVPVKRAQNRPKRNQLLPTQVDSPQLERTLSNLARRSALEYRERGVRVLHITFGLLNWKEPGTFQEVASPVLLTPIEITRKSRKDLYNIRVPSVEDEVVLNPALTLKLRNDFQTELPPLPNFEKDSLLDYLEAIAESGGDLGWTVDPVVQIGLFSFHKLVMYQDLSDNVDLIARHPIISALAGAPGASLVRSSLPTERDLDRIVDPKETFQVLDADSSQQLCIQYALRGQSFVMHGPPGTGKSQTIANTISEFIAAGKRVLFVSEKMAALEVVYSRLKDRGLDDFCLEIHSHKANKREVVAEISRCLTEHLKPRRTISDADIERLRTRRDQLNNYVESLHREHFPIKVTAFRLLCELTKLEKEPFVPFDYPGLTSLDQKRFFQLEEYVRRLSNVWRVEEEGDNFPWRGSLDARFTPETRSMWISILDTSIDNIRQLSEESFRLVETFGIPLPETVVDYVRLEDTLNIISSSPRPPASWFLSSDINDVEAVANKNSIECAEYWVKKRRLERFYEPLFLSQPPDTYKRIEQAWKRLDELLNPIPRGDRNLLQRLTELSSYLDELQVWIKRWREDAELISQILGITQEVETIGRVQQLADLTLLCSEEHRPEATWLDRDVLREVKVLLEKAVKEYGRREELRRRLQGEYHKELFNLDLGSLIDWFKKSKSSMLKYLTPTHYRMRSIVSKVHRSGRVPKSVLEDLEAASELLDLEESIQATEEDFKQFFASYFSNGDIDFTSARSALKAAERIMRAVGRAKAPQETIDNLAAGFEPDEELLRVGRKLMESLSMWSSETRKLDRIIPFKILPTTGRSMKSSKLQEVLAWAAETTNRLSTLSETCEISLKARILDRPSNIGELLKDLRDGESLSRFESDMKKRSDELRNMFSDHFNGLATDWEGILHIINWTKQIISLFEDGVPPVLIPYVSEGGVELPPFPDFGPELKALRWDIDVLNGRFETPLWSGKINDLKIKEVLEKLEVLLSRVDELQTWVDFKELEAALTHAGLRPFLERLKRQRFKGMQLVDIFHKSVYQGLANIIFEGDPALKTFRGQDHEQLIADFQELDRRLIELSAYRVIEKANHLKPQGLFVLAPDSEITILQREAMKKRRHLPLRLLFERIPNLLMTLKPCLMMSPISVSQFLTPGRIHFDLVVFDEASQIYTEDAVGSIYRGDQLIVAGDNKQLPPTPFFQYTLDEDFDWDEAEGYEFDVFDSVLDECMAINLPVRMLRWHYRSKHDSLINFSNTQFYDGRLILFPAPTIRDEILGIRHVYVPNGVYDRGGARNNPREAETVADIVFDHFSKYPGKTLGVVTFSISQMNTVQNEVERRLRDRPEFERFFVEDRLNGFFVKNLENVQGDERDVMIFSVGYGYDDKGKMTLNFGPLNKPGGERRLNVAITRAREKVILVSSIKSSDINVNETKASGVRHLYHYMRYAERSSEPSSPWITGDDDYGSPFELDVAEEVKKLGYEVTPQIGNSSFRVDIAVSVPEDPNRFILGILCDGENYRSANTARDRDRLRQQVLERLGWRIHWVWSPDWVQRRETEIRRLRKDLRQSEQSVG